MFQNPQSFKVETQDTQVSKRSTGTDEDTSGKLKSLDNPKHSENLP